MRYGLTGAHRSGKTTLAKEIAEQKNLPLVLTSSSAIFSKMGLSPQDNLTFKQRLEVQKQILADAKEKWDQHDSFVTDRTPLDFIAYTLADISSGAELSKQDDWALLDYKQDCFDALIDHFDLVLHVPLLDGKVEEGEGKANASWGHRIHIELLLRSLCSDMQSSKPMLIGMGPDQQSREDRLDTALEVLELAQQAQSSIILPS